MSQPQSTLNVSEPALRKIKKLFQLAEGSVGPDGKKVVANQNEADNAMAMAQKLLLEANLTYEDVNSLFILDKEQEEHMKEMVCEEIYLGSRMIWKKTLAGIVAEHNLCSLLQDRGAGNLYFIGRRRNVELVIPMYVWILFQIERMADRCLATNTDLEGNPLRFPYGKPKWKASFAEGAAWKVDSRLKKGIHSFVTQNTNAIVLRTDQENKEFIQKRFGRTRVIKRQESNTDYAAFSQGSAAGDKISLVRKPKEEKITQNQTVQQFLGQ